MQLEGVIRSVVEADGLELVEAAFVREGGRRTLRVTVDREGGLDLDAIATVSERLSRRLDAADVVTGGRYSLEVSSPGIERALSEPRHFTRHVGATVKVKTAEPVQGALSHLGTLAAADDDGFTLVTEAGERRLTYADVASARTVFEWGGGTKK
ncbi:MAG: ribosome maturation factor RimP [Actinomycetota bacterium]